MGRILLNLSCDDRSLWRTFHRNDVISGPRPFKLVKCQLLSQSLSGEASSVLDCFNCLASDTGCCSMVVLSWWPRSVSEQRGIVKIVGVLPIYRGLKKTMYKHCQSFVIDMVEAETTMRCGSVVDNVLRLLQLVCQQACLDLTGDVGGVHNP